MQNSPVNGHFPGWLAPDEVIIVWRLLQKKGKINERRGGGATESWQNQRGGDWRVQNFFYIQSNAQTSAGIACCVGEMQCIKNELEEERQGASGVDAAAGDLLAVLRAGRPA